MTRKRYRFGYLVIFKIVPLLFVGLLLQAQTDERGQAALVAELKAKMGDGLVPLRPLLLELVNLSQGKPELESFLFLLALSYQDEFAETEDQSLLEEAVRYYEEYVEKFPVGSRRDFVRLNLGAAYKDLENVDKALEHYGWLYRNSDNPSLRRGARTWMADLYIKNERAAEGISLYLEAFTTSLLDPELRAQAASWLLQGYLASGEPEKIPPYLRYLTGRYEAIYDPMFNVTLLNAGDELFEKKEYDQAILLYTFVKPRDAIIEFYEELIIKIRARQRYISPESDNFTVVQNQLQAAEANLAAVREIRSYDVDMQWRIARVFKEAERTWEALWAFFHLYQDYPSHEQVEDFLYISFEEARKVSDDTMVLNLALEYLNNPEFRKYDDQVTLGLAEYYHRKEMWEELVALATEYLKAPRNYRVAAQLINYVGNYYVLVQEYKIMNEYMSPLVREMNGHEPAYEASRYWTGLSQILLADYARASENFGQFIQDYTDNSPYYEDAYYRYAIALYGEQKHDEAEAQFSRFVDKYPDSGVRGEAELYLGDLKRDRGALSESLVHYDNVSRFTDLVSFISKATFAKSEVQQRLDRADQAIATLQSYIDTYGERGQLAEAYYRIGMIYNDQGRYDERFEIHALAIRQLSGDSFRYTVDDVIGEYVRDHLGYEQRFKDSIELLERLIEEDAFRKQFVSDRVFQYQYMQSIDGRYVDPDLTQLMVRDREFRAKVTETEIRTDLNGNPIPPKGPVITEAMVDAEFGKQLSFYKRKAESIAEYTPRALFPALLKEGSEEDNLIKIMRARRAIELTMGKKERELQPPRFTVDELQSAPPAIIVWEAQKREESNPEEAKLLYRIIFEKHPFSDTVYDALVASGEISIRAAEESGDPEDWKEALQYYNLVTERYAMRAKDAKPFLRKGKIFSELGMDTQAVEVLGLILRNPAWKGLDHAKAHLELGLAYRRRNNLEEAHGFFERLIVAYGGFPETVSWAYYYDLITLQEMNDQEGVQLLLDEYKTRIAVLSETEAHKLIDEKFTL